MSPILIIIQYVNIFIIILCNSELVKGTKLG